MRSRPFLQLALHLTLLGLVACPADDATPGVTFDPGGGGYVPADVVGVDTLDAGGDTAPDAAPDAGAADTDAGPGDGGSDATDALDANDGATCGVDADCDHVVVGTCEAARCLNGACVAGPADDGDLCDDGDPCTVGDQCAAGACGGAPLDCDDGNPCTADLCDGGKCATVDNSDPCDDGNPCTTVDTCDGGACVGVGNGCVCAVDADCAAYEDTDPCTGALVCVDGLCEPDAATIPDCAGEVGPCGVGSCAPGIGCVADVLPDGAACDDGNTCTQGETCLGGACVPATTIPCDGGDPCTGDVCTPAGLCTHPPVEGPCDDGDLCTEDDACAGGACKPGPKKDCDDGTVCTDDGCAIGKCVHVPTWAQPCDDGDACTTGDTCKDGVCLPAGATPCDDANPCTADSCDPMTGCVHTPAGGACDDGDPCTLDEACSGGACVPATVTSCDDGEPCTLDTCLPDGGCKFTAGTGTPCDDGDPCTGGDACTDGACSPGPFDLCGDCAGQADLAPCDDGDDATGPDVCLSGACVGFTRTLWTPVTTPKTAATALVDVTASQGLPVAAGWRVDGFGTTTSFVVALSADKAPSVMTGSERTDSVYRAIRHRAVVGTAGRVGFQTGTTWDGAPGLWAALKTVPGMGDLTDVWGTTLAAPPGLATPTEQWLVGGLNINGTSPFLARCAREANPAGGFKWYCEDLSALPVAGVGPAGLWGLPAPCEGCTPATVVKHVLVGNKLPGDSDNLIFESAGLMPQWALASTLDSTPGDKLLAVDGADLDSVWAVGTQGLWARRDAAGWESGPQLGGFAVAYDLESVHVAHGRAWVVGTRHTYMGSLDRAELVLMAAPASGGALSPDHLAVLSTHECPPCQVGEDVHGNNALTGVWVHDGTLWVVGREWSDGAQHAVVYRAPVP